jgi:hypothetical protein
MKGAYLQIPVILTMTGNFSPATEATSADYSCGLMNFYHNIIHSISVMCNGQVVKNHTNYENIYHNFRLTSSISQDGFKNLEHIGFCDDVIASVVYEGSGASFNGNGVSRNKVLFTAEAVSGVFNQKTSNDGLRERIRVIAFDSDGLTDADGGAFSVLQTATKVGQVYKSHIFQKLNQTSTNDDGVLQLCVNMIVPLKTFSIFANCPLHKAAFWELQLNYNHTHGSFTTDGNKKLIIVIKIVDFRGKNGHIMDLTKLAYLSLLVYITNIIWKARSQIAYRLLFVYISNITRKARSQIAYRLLLVYISNIIR